jgi:hypothetical protein
VIYCYTPVRRRNLGTDCVVTLAERASGYVLIGKMPDYTMAALNKRALKLMRGHPGWFKTITADNGTEFHAYRDIEDATDVTIYFATPYHSWERGTNENTNGLIRQYLPKGTEYGEPDPGAVQCNCAEAEPAAQKALRLHEPTRAHRATHGPQVTPAITLSARAVTSVRAKFKARCASSATLRPFG